MELKEVINQLTSLKLNAKESINKEDENDENNIFKLDYEALSIAINKLKNIKE